MNQLGSLSDLKNVLQRRLLFIAVITLVGCALSVYFALQQPKIYETIAVVQIEDAIIAETSTGRTNAGHRLQLIEQRMMARDNVIEIIEDYNLFADLDEPLGYKVALFREAARITPITDSSRPWEADANPTGLTINVSLDDPQQAADVANELLARIVDQGRTRQIQENQQALAFFVGEESRLTRLILDLEKTLANFKQVNSESLPDTISAQRSRLGNLRQTELDIQRDIIELQTNARRQREGVIESQVAQLAAQQRLVQDRISEVEAALLKAPQVEQELNILTRELDQLRTQLQQVSSRRVELETERTLQEQQQTERYEVLETALVPETPVSRSRRKTAVMGGAASLILAVGAALMLEMLNPAIRNSAQLERALGIQTVVSIPTVHTTRERRFRKLFLGGLVLGIFAVLVAALRLMEDKLAGWGPFRKGDRQVARL